MIDSDLGIVKETFRVAQKKSRNNKKFNEIELAGYASYRIEINKFIFFISYTLYTKAIKYIERLFSFKRNKRLIIKCNQIRVTDDYLRSSWRSGFCQ